MNIAKPVLLSIHPTEQCDYHCHNCYLTVGRTDAHEKNPQFFIDLIPIAKKLGMTDVAVPMNFVAVKPDFKEVENPLECWDSVDKNFYYFKWLKKATLDNGLDFTVTCNYNFIENYKHHLDFSGISLMSISINDFVTPTIEDKLKAIETMRDVKKIVGEINCNILLSPNMVKLLNEGLAEKILEVANTIFLLASEPLYIPLKNVYDLIGKIDKRLLDQLGNRIHLDSCVRREMGMTGGICSKHEFIYVNPYGEIKQCSYDQRDLFKLDKPSDLEYAYDNLYPRLALATCDLMNGEFLKNKKAALVKVS